MLNIMSKITIYRLAVSKRNISTCRHLILNIHENSTGVKRNVTLCRTESSVVYNCLVKRIQHHHVENHYVFTAELHYRIANSTSNMPLARSPVCITDGHPLPLSYTTAVYQIQTPMLHALP